jgi:hypothetical protein
VSPRAALGVITPEGATLVHPRGDDSPIGGDVNDEQRAEAERCAGLILAEIPRLLESGRAIGGDVAALAVLVGYFHRLMQFGVLPVAVARPPGPEVRA